MVKIADEWAKKAGASAIDPEAAADYALKRKLYDRHPPTQRELCIGHAPRTTTGQVR